MNISRIFLFEKIHFLGVLLLLLRPSFLLLRVPVFTQHKEMFLAPACLMASITNPTRIETPTQFQQSNFVHLLFIFLFASLSILLKKKKKRKKIAFVRDEKKNFSFRIGRGDHQSELKLALCQKEKKKKKPCEFS